MATSVNAQVKLCVDRNWQFVRQDMMNQWQPVNLPHCYNAFDGVAPDAKYYQGVGWYRTTLQISNPYPGGHTLLEFEGAGQKTEVYVDTILVGSHVGGYDRWMVDVTRFGNGSLPIMVRCDNSRDVQMIPSNLSDFCLYGGLYRHVNLLYMPKQYLEDVRLDVVGNTVSISPQYPMQVEIFTPTGKRIYNGTNRKPITINNPMLWDVDKPQLYTARIHFGEQLIEKRFGFRSFEFKEHGPFYLNGRRLLLNGTHRHEDHAGVGAAMTDEQIRYEMQQIKDMGANFIRLGHYQQSDLVLQLCDSLGLLVWEEIPWCRGGVGGETYQAQARRMLENMINQHRHHPSIILWGLGNENDWPGDFSDKVDTLGIRELMISLNTLAHQMDANRLTTIRRCDFCADIVDVYSPSIWAGWYARKFSDYREMEQTAIKRFSRFLHAEWGGDSHAGRHAEAGFDIEAGDRNGDWSESYIVRLYDWHLKEQAQMPNLTGSAFWTFKDFCTPLRPNNPIPYVNQKGVCQRDGTLKESYYVFQSYWSTKPMLHIYGHTWPIRWGNVGEEKEILVYSNQPEVELFVNGKSYGKKHRSISDYPAQGFHWYVPLATGTNHISAVSTGLTDEITCEYLTSKWGAPAQIMLSYQDGLITAQICDEDGIPCLDSKDWVEFSLVGDGLMHKNEGTNTGSSRIQAANGRASIRVDAMAPVRENGVFGWRIYCFLPEKKVFSTLEKDCYHLPPIYNHP